MKIGYLSLLLSALITGCDKPKPATAPPRPALVMVINSEAEVNNMVLVGEVRPRYESVQSFRINGKIIERKVEVGTYVKKGQILARLDSADAKLTAAAAEAEVKSAEASQFLAAAEVIRYRELSAKNFVSKSALDTKEAELKNANARLKETRSRAEVSTNQTTYTHLLADREGVITMIRAEPGQVVATGDPIAQIADTRHLDILVAVPESHIKDIKTNTQTAIKLWAENTAIYPGVIREISPSADPNTRTFNVRITVSHTDAALKLGMTVKVKINPQEGTQSTSILIPSSALTEINGNKTVWVIDNNNMAQPRTVSAGPFSEQGILITSGLKIGEKIAVAGVHTLIKGQPVRPMVTTSP